MTKKMFLLSFVLLACTAVFSQVTIENCYQKARANYPLIKRYDLIERTREFNLSVVSKAWLPQIGLSAKATYQSDVTKIPIDFSKIFQALGLPPDRAPIIPELSKDQYMAALEINQTIWDGGITAAMRKGIKAKTEAEKQEVEVNLYALRERVNQMFFGILMCDAMLEQNKLFQSELQTNYERVTHLVAGGLANQADLDAVRVGQLKAKQGETQILHGKKALVEMMSVFISEKLDENTVFQKPADTGLQNFGTLQNNRPELALFNANLASLDAAKSEINASLTPKIGFYIMGGYGRPALNMLKDEFSPFYIGGFRLSWNISSFYTRKGKLNIIENNRNNIEVGRETFLFNMSLSQTNKENEIDKYRDLLKSDEEIVELRKSVRLAAEAKVESGTMSVTDLMHEQNAEQLARQDKIVHEIELLQAIYNLKFITNN